MGLTPNLVDLPEYGQLLRQMRQRLTDRMIAAGEAAAAIQPKR